MNIRTQLFSRPGLLSFGLLLGAALFVACGNDNGGPIPEAGSPDAGMCSPIPTTFTAVHDQIFATMTCARTGCHDSTKSGNLDLSAGKARVYVALLEDSTNASDVVGTLPHRIVASDLTNSFLWRKVHDDDPPGFGARMPLGCGPSFPGSCLNQCQLDAIQGWITAGAMDD